MSESTAQAQLDSFCDAILSISREMKVSRSAVVYSIATKGEMAARVLCSRADTSVTWNEPESINAFAKRCLSLQAEATNHLMNTSGMKKADSEFIGEMIKEYRLFLSSCPSPSSMSTQERTQHERAARMHLLPLLRYCSKAHEQLEAPLSGAWAAGSSLPSETLVSAAPSELRQNPKVLVPTPTSVPPTSVAIAAGSRPLPTQADIQHEPPKISRKPNANATVTDIPEDRKIIRAGQVEPAAPTGPAVVPLTVKTSQFEFQENPEVPVQVGADGAALKVKALDERRSRQTILASNTVDVTDAFEIEVVILDRKKSKIVIGMCQAHTPLSHCSRWIPGEKELHGSVGLAIPNDTSAILTMDDKALLNAPCDTRDPTVVTVSLSGGKLWFAIDGNWLKQPTDLLSLLPPCTLHCCPNKHPMSEFWVDEQWWTCNGCNVSYPRAVTLTCDACKYFLCKSCEQTAPPIDGVPKQRSFCLAVGVFHEGQLIQLRRGRQWHFKDRWTAGRVRSMGRTVECKKSCKFTEYTVEEFLGSDAISVTLDVRKLADRPISFGVFRTELVKECQHGLLGLENIPDSVACLLAPGTVRVFWNGNSLFRGKCNSRDPTKIRLVIIDGILKFFIDEQEVDIDLEAVRLQQGLTYRLGVSMQLEGQLATLRTDEDLQTQTLVNGDLHALVRALLRQDHQRDRYRFVDNMQSINCNNIASMACCVTTFVATIYTKNILDMSSANVAIRVVTDSSRVIVIGVVDVEAEGHERFCIGSKELKNSVGIATSGHIFKDGEVMGSIGRTIRRNDTVAFSFPKGKACIKVNGKDVPLPDSFRALEFNKSGKVRVAVSLTEKGQSVKIGDALVTDEEKAFLLANGVDPSILEPSKEPTNSTTAGPSESAVPLDPPPVDQVIPANDLNAAEVFENRVGIDDRIRKCQLNSELVSITRDQRLGKGGFGTVYAGVWQGTTVAIKEMIWEADERQRREILISRSLSHPNVASIHGWCRSDNNLWIVMPLVSDGTLSDLLHAFEKQEPRPVPKPSEGGPLGWKRFIEVCCGILRGLRYMATREPPVIHRDLKPSNILMQEGQPQLSDFGLSTNQLCANTRGGTQIYMAPEQMEGADQAPAADIYSFGCVAWQLLQCPRTPRDDCRGLAMYRQISDGVPLDMTGIPEGLRFIEQCFRKNPSERPSHDALLQQMVDAGKRRPECGDQRYVESLVHDVQAECRNPQDVYGHTDYTPLATNNEAPTNPSPNARASGLGPLTPYDFSFCTPSPSVAVLGGGIAFELQTRDRQTVLCDQTFTPSDNFDLTFAIHRRCKSSIVVGIIQADTPAALCAKWVPGEKQLHRSVGLLIPDDFGVTVFNADLPIMVAKCDTTDPVSVTLSVRDGRLSFAVDGEWLPGCGNLRHMMHPRSPRCCSKNHRLSRRWVDDDRWICFTCNTKFAACVGLVCDECRYYMCCRCDDSLAPIAPPEQCSLRVGIGAFKEGQFVQLRRGMQWHFTTALSPSGPIPAKEIYKVSRMGRTVMANNVFKWPSVVTHVTKESFAGDSEFTVTLGLDMLQNESVLVGVIRAEDAAKGQCKVGSESFRGSVACAVKRGSAKILQCGVQLALFECDTRDPTLVTLRLRNAVLHFLINDVECQVPTELLLDRTTEYVIAVTFQQKDQKATLLTDDDVKVSLLRAAPAVQRATRRAGEYRCQFVNNVLSVRCNHSKTVACCMESIPATIYTKEIFSLADTISFTVRILTLGVESVIIGAMESSAKGHANLSIGLRELKNSFGVATSGHLVYGGTAVGRLERSLQMNDTVTIAFAGSRVSLKVNDVPVQLPEEVRGLKFVGNTRFGVSFAEKGQSVKIGDGPVSDEDRAFLRAYEVDPNREASVACRMPNLEAARLPAGSTENRMGIDDQIKRSELKAESIQLTASRVDLPGYVVRATWEGAAVAVKETVWNADERQRREIFISQSLEHVNIASIHGWCRVGNKLWVVMPLPAEGTLARILQPYQTLKPLPVSVPGDGGQLGWKFFFDVCCGLLRALEYLATREPPIIHRDICPMNILMCNGQPQLTNFGLSTNELHASTHTGSQSYMSSEQFEGAVQSPATDVYSFGCVAWELLQCPQVPRGHCRGLLALSNELANGVPLNMDGIPPELHVLESCFRKNPEDRPTHDTLLRAMLAAQEKFVGPVATEASQSTGADQGSQENGGA